MFVYIYIYIYLASTISFIKYIIYFLLLHIYLSIYLSILLISSYQRESPRLVVAKVLEFNIAGNEFEFHSRYYIYFQTNSLEKAMNRILLSALGFIVLNKPRRLISHKTKKSSIYL